MDNNTSNTRNNLIYIDISKLKKLTLYLILDFINDKQLITNFRPIRFRRFLSYFSHKPTYFKNLNSSSK